MLASDSLLMCVFALAAVQCRMEANYAHQQELDMIPLMVEKDYSPKCVSPHCVLIEALLTSCLLQCCSHDVFDRMCVHAQRVAWLDPRHTDVVSDVGC